MATNLKEEIKKKILAKIKAKGKLDKNDSERLREFSRSDKREGDEQNPPYYRYPEGTYKKVGERYIKQDKND